MKKAILYLLVFTSIMSCNSDESNPGNDNLTGNWKLIAFVNETNDTVLTASDFENSNEITINFTENYKFTGTTFLNDFFGDYSTETESILIFKDFFGTEVNENDWGNLFYDNLKLNYNQSTSNWESRYEISDTILKLFYSEYEYMTFEKL